MRALFLKFEKSIIFKKCSKCGTPQIHAKNKRKSALIQSNFNFHAFDKLFYESRQ